MGLSHSHRAPLPFKEKVLREYTDVPSRRFLGECLRLYMEVMHKRGPLLTPESFSYVFSSVLKVR
jgi:hypothetical protein